MVTNPSDQLPPPSLWRNGKAPHHHLRHMEGRNFAPSRGWAMIPMARAVELRPRQIHGGGVTRGQTRQGGLSKAKKGVRRGNRRHPSHRVTGGSSRFSRGSSSATPRGRIRGGHFPYIKDVVNSPAFNRYAKWAKGRGIPPGCSRPPPFRGRRSQQEQRVEQKGVA